MVGIKGPITGPDHPDRTLDCEFALEPAFTALADEAIGKGWHPNEVELALLNLALARMKGAQANLDTDQAIRRALLMIELGQYPDKNRGR
ncbi:hypothetical protein [Pararhizobium haloflavum]|uniref:hypothetical protein n=1 Tax=Pararhizobium haloflavum TaxID=2037914 RepID=UPI00130011C0|nr:hypothetical protein [Pararhizobium haloflavum]